MLADFVLGIHFCIVIFISSGIFIVPIGHKLDWKWIANSRLRISHLGLMILVTLETLLGIACPLTSIENWLRGVSKSESFVRQWIKQIIFWDFPTLYFIILYCICLGWIILMWKLFPPLCAKKLKQNNS